MPSVGDGVAMTAATIALGVIGLLAAAGAVVEAVVHAARRRQYGDILVVLAVAALTVWVLLTFGHLFLQ